MAKDFQTGICGENWWNLSSRTMFCGGLSPCSMALNDMSGSYGWPVDLVDFKARSCKETNSVSDSSPIFQDAQKPPPQTADSTTAAGIFLDSTLQMMDFGLSSSVTSDWNQPLFCSDETGISSSQAQKDFSAASESSTINTFKPITNENHSVNNFANCSLPNESSASSYGCPTVLLQSSPSPLDSQPPQQSFPEIPSSVSYQTASNYATNSGEFFLKPSMPKMQPGLQFSNGTTFWNCSTTGANDMGSSFLPSPRFEEKSISHSLATKRGPEELQDSPSMVTKNGTLQPAPPLKRVRVETPSPLPIFKVRKEKLGDRITALQQLVSPFGKTDTASVLHEAIEYIKFLHDQVNALSSPYMKNGATNSQYQQGSENLREPEGPKIDLQSRGLCLVPISSTIPVATESPCDFWTPTLGGTLIR